HVGPRLLGELALVQLHFPGAVESALGQCNAGRGGEGKRNEYRLEFHDESPVTRSLCLSGTSSSRGDFMVKSILVPIRRSSGLYNAQSARLHRHDRQSPDLRELPSARPVAGTAAAALGRARRDAVYRHPPGVRAVVQAAAARAALPACLIARG